MSPLSNFKYSKWPPWTRKSSENASVVMDLDGVPVWQEGAGPVDNVDYDGLNFIKGKHSANICIVTVYVLII